MNSENRQGSYLGIVLARGGSKRLPGKNVRDFAGKPMIEWTFRAGAGSARIDRMVLSTDDQAIADVALKCGCEVPFLRPAELAQDDSSSVDAIVHLVDQIGFDHGNVVLLQPTSPLRTSRDIDLCIEAFEREGAKAAATLCSMQHNMKWALTLSQNGRVQRPFAAQDEPLYAPNGAVYVADIEWLRESGNFWVDGETLGVEMPASRSIDVDTLDDFQIAEAIKRAQASSTD